ncbi:reverse transcriptase domain-containing protein [Tanacetum coccineum]
MADNRTMAQILQAPIEGYEDAIVVPPINANNFELKQTLINLVQINQFTGKQDPHNHLRFFNTKVTSTFSHFQSSGILDLAFCFFLSLSKGLDGNDFLVFHDNIHQFQQTVAVGNFVQRNPPNLANQMRPPGFNPPNVQNNQGVSKTDFVSYAKANDANMNNLQMKLDNFQRNQNDFQRSYNDSQKKQEDFQNIMLSLMQNYHKSNTASSSNSGTRTKPGDVNEKSAKIKFREYRTSPTSRGRRIIFMEIPKPKGKKTVNVKIQEPQPDSYQPKLPYPERMKVRKNDKPSAQHSRFLKMFKQLRLEIGLKDALVEMPKFNKWLSSLLRNKEKLEEIAITTVNAECSAIILNRVPEKLEDPGKFLIPCALQELNRTSALADSGASINLLPHSIYKQLRLEALTPTRMTLELANHSVTHPIGIAEDVVVRVDGFTFLADFVMVNFEPDPRVPIIIGRPFLRTEKALIDLYEETLTLRVGKEELVYYADKYEKNEGKKSVHAISIIDFSKDDPFSGSTTIPSDAPFPSSSPMKTSDSTFEEFIDEFTLPNSLPPGDEVSIYKKDIHEEMFQIYSNPLFEFDDNFKSRNVNPLFEEKDKDVKIKSSPSFKLTSLEESDSIPPRIDLTLPPTLEVSSSNPTSPTLTEEKTIICLLSTFLHKKPKPLSRPQEVEEMEIEDDKVSSEIPIDTIVMPIRITFDNPIDFNDHFSKPKDFKKDLTVAFNSTESSILPHPLLDSDSPFTAELSASVTLNSLENEDKVFKPGILVYHTIYDKNLVTLETNLRENISSGTLLFLKEPSFFLPPPEPPDVEICLKFETIAAVKNDSNELNEDKYFDPGGVKMLFF